MSGYLRLRHLLSEKEILIQDWENTPMKGSCCPALSENNKELVGFRLETYGNVQVF